MGKSSLDQLNLPLRPVTKAGEQSKSGAEPGRAWGSGARRPSRPARPLPLWPGPAHAAPRGLAPGAATRSGRGRSQNGEELLRGAHLHLHSFLVCDCVVHFIRKSPYVFPSEPLCLWKCSRIREKGVCAGLSYRLRDCVRDVCNCPNVNFRSLCVGKSIKLEKVLLCWNA